MKRLITLYVFSFGVAVTSFSLALAGLLQPKWIHFQTPHSSPLKLTTDYGLFQRCDSSKWTGDRITCRKFTTRRQDCSPRSLSFSHEARLAEVFRKSSDLRSSDVEMKSDGGSVKILRGDSDSMMTGESLSEDEDDEAWGFCDSWITAGYFQQLALVLGAASVIASFAAILSPLHSRRNPYRLISSLLFAHALCLITSTSLVAHEFNTSDRFIFGSRLAESFIMSTIAWSLDVVVVAALVLVVGVLKVGDEERGYERIRDW